MNRPDQLSTWQNEIQATLTTPMNTQRGRRLLLPLLAGVGLSVLSACRRPSREVNIIGDQPASLPPQLRPEDESAGKQSFESVVVKLIQAYVRPEYQGGFFRQSSVPTPRQLESIKRNMRREGLLSVSRPGPAGPIRRYDHFVDHPSFYGQIGEGDFTVNNQGQPFIERAAYNIAFEPDQSWSRFSINAVTPLDLIPQISNSVKKVNHQNGRVSYGLSAEHLKEAADLLIVLPDDAISVYTQKDQSNPVSEDFWKVDRVSNSDLADINFSIYKSGGWRLILTKPNYTMPPPL